MCQGEGGRNCTLTPEYNASIALPTYLAVSEMAKFVGDDATATTFREYYQSAKDEFKQKYGSSSSFATGRGLC